VRAAAAATALGGLDVLVNNAGISGSILAASAPRMAVLRLA
jgi:NAD(P)-dependent dehydrogenase (short-subunit alcohol dehydrogenase family)